LVGYLVQLMEEGRFEQCLRLAEQQLLHGGMTLSELATVNLVVCRCRLGLQDVYGSINPGLLAAKLSRSTRDWDTYGRALLNVGTAYMGIRHYDRALRNLYMYFEHLSDYLTASRFEGAVWRSIGIAHQSLLQSDRAIRALERARQWYDDQESDRGSFGCIHDLLNVHLQVHEVNPKAGLDPALDLLLEEKAIVARHPDDSYYRSHYLLDRASVYLHRACYGRARVSASQARSARSDDMVLAFHSFMVLQRCSVQSGEAKEAIGYALAARVTAMQAKRHDLEALATQTIADLMGSPEAPVPAELDKMYHTMEMDLDRYLPDTASRSLH